ncbi:hypothetical protein HFO91_01560 [Rhizobium leguminosarum]|uniref:hypothetical protein n=1 Tax=Rhizobium leguminosarum TaxID=384 RepID=UPI001C972B69|nr:hypothetical protein [Rhizobium leguminosarum]MBY5366653.1 hypothetical protein [Rhizobium leguminosarum]MBY5448365.1 hypothetical protein [Rhizobium leguminosarum]
MTKVTAARFVEMDDEIARLQAALLKHAERLARGEESEQPQPPIWSIEEQRAWSEALQAKVRNAMIVAWGGEAAYDAVVSQGEAMRQARREADRSIAIVHVTVVEEFLRSAIERYFPGRHSDPEIIDRLFDPMRYGPLNTFTARVDIAFALGIVGSGARKALKLIAEIRNKFAHKLEIHSFDHPDVTKLIDKLKYIDFAITGPNAEGLMHLWNRSPNSEVTSGSGWRASDNSFDHRGKFEKTCGFLQHSLRTSVPGSTHPDLHEK